MDKTDSQLKGDIEQELQWDPQVNSSQIGVSVDAGAVNLSGEVDTNAQKWAAEDAAKRVHGVRAIAQNIMVKLRTDHERSDAEIASAVHSCLSWDVYVPETVLATVRYGAVTLSGQVKWNFERVAAERAVRHLKGVVTVHNGVTIAPQVSQVDVHEQVWSALRRHGFGDSSSIHVASIGGEITLTGHAPSWQSIVDAENAAWSVPGVTQVFDRVKLTP